MPSGGWLIWSVNQQQQAVNQQQHSYILTSPFATTHTNPAQAMRVMNKRLNLPNMQKVLMEFEKQNERMEMTSDMMGDAIDDAMEVGVLGGGGGGGLH